MNFRWDFCAIFVLVYVFTIVKSLKLTTFDQLSHMMKVFDTCSLLHVRLEDLLSAKRHQKVVSEGVEIENGFAILWISQAKRIELVLQPSGIGGALGLNPWVVATDLQVVKLVQEPEKELVFGYCRKYWHSHSVEEYCWPEKNQRVYFFLIKLRSFALCRHTIHACSGALRVGNYGHF